MRVTQRGVAGMSIALLFAALGGVFACAGRRSAAPLPTYEWRSAEETLSAIDERWTEIDTLTAQGTLTLQQPDGDDVRLDAVLVVSPPDHLRLRAWKFNRAIFDFTSNPEGQWLWTAEDVDLGAGLFDQSFEGFWTVLSPERWTDENGKSGGVEVFERDGLLMLERPLEIEDDQQGGASLLVEIDRSTLTVQRYAVFDERRGAIQEIRLSDYRAIGPHIWPARIRATGEQGNLSIRTDEIEINEPLPENVFAPPAGAHAIQTTAP